MKLVVVESPAKATTINKYLGSDYRVLASYGHVRDLEAKDGSVRPDEDFAMTWEVGDRAKKRIADIVEAAKQADTLYLATDPDREGEAISWHVLEVLQQKRALHGMEPQRVVFHEVTRNAVIDAIANARTIKHDLVDAYLARRALDYLVGFTLSPVLWRKLPGSRSAGRVQSVALRLVCEREAEIEAFKAREFWTIGAVFETGKGQKIAARLTHLDGRKLDKFDLPDEASALAAARTVEAGRFAVAEIEHREVRRNPAPPFTTSTLQQEASRKLGLTASQTMRAAQRLYEGVDIGGETVGLITYMRTDSVNLSNEALEASRAMIRRDFGDAYVPDEPRRFRSTARNAQEAHEAIRPTDYARRPEDVADRLEQAERRLYELIWKRATACQMASARLDQVTIDIGAADGSSRLRATGSVILFDGFLKLYREGRDDAPEDEDGEGRILPAVAKGEDLSRGPVTPDQHFTQPPPRFTEASLVKRLEELGIGRPSTYASILQVLQDRDYVRLEAKRFIPEDRGRLVTTFLTSFFDRYVEYGFTAQLEQQLDDISNGRLDWREVLRDFWRHFSAKVHDIQDLTIRQVLDAIDEELGPHFFKGDGSGKDPRACPACGGGRLGVKLGRHGAFIGCSNYPECRFTRPLVVPDGDGEAAADANRVLGTDPETGNAVTLRAGRFGPYLQLGEGSEDAKPKRSSLPRNVKPEAVDLAMALGLLALPREIGAHPESREPISAGIGRFGPYIKHGKAYKSLGPDEDVLTIGLNRAVDLLAEAKTRGDAPGVLRTIGPHPEDGEPVTVHKGRFGPYVKHRRVMASLPKGAEPETFAMEEAVPLLEARAAKAGPAKGGKKSAPKATKAAASEKPVKQMRKAPAKSTAKTPAKTPSRPRTNPAATAEGGKLGGGTVEAMERAAAKPTSKPKRSPARAKG